MKWNRDLDPLSAKCALNPHRTCRCGGPKSPPATQCWSCRYPNEPKIRNQLTDLERLFVQGFAIGKCVKEIAAARNRSVKTIQYTKARVMRKLNLHADQQLVRYAIFHGLIPNTDPAQESAKQIPWLEPLDK